MSLDASWNLQALSALDVSAMAASENIANSSTENFRPYRAELEDGVGGKGVQVADVVELTGGYTNSTSLDSPLAPEARTDYSTGMLRPLASSGEGNFVDLAREMTDLIQIDRAFSANVATINSIDQTVGHLVDVLT